MNSQQVDCGGDETPQQPLMSTDKALEILIDSANIIDGTIFVGLEEALNSVLASDIQSNINVPSFDNSAMDGYAINLDDNLVNISGESSFIITDRISAGTTGKTLLPGCAARIFTGAPIPRGANTVIMQEECNLIEDDTKIQIYRPLALNENIRPCGNDIQVDDVILKSGIKLKPQDIALSASVGVNELEIINKITVGVFFTGDELVEPGNTLKDGQIYNSNRYSLVALLNNLGCIVINLGNIKDTLDSTCEALKKLMHDCDIIMTTGGVSVGEEDHIKDAVQSLGRLTLWRIKMKPGKPLAFGKVGNAAFIGLPGNPVSAMVTFLLFARPFIKKMQGLSDYMNYTFKVESNFNWHGSKPRREFVRVRVDSSSSPAKANMYPKQGSDVLSSIVWADGLLEIPEGASFVSGELLNFYPFKEMMS
ncbi:MAG TPA: molybdopterin molybdotransferase MoeA [Candidatus Thioglobus sp.]|nr:molybdopterin molybdotransferase MoeA [Candidatus Thioglobus sp.]